MGPPAAQPQTARIEGGADDARLLAEASAVGDADGAGEGLRFSLPWAEASQPPLGGVTVTPIARDGGAGGTSPIGRIAGDGDAPLNANDGNPNSHSRRSAVPAPSQIIADALRASSASLRPAKTQVAAGGSPPTAAFTVPPPPGAKRPRTSSHSTTPPLRSSGRADAVSSPSPSLLGASFAASPLPFSAAPSPSPAVSGTPQAGRLRSHQPSNRYHQAAAGQGMVIPPPPSASRPSHSHASSTTSTVPPPSRVGGSQARMRTEGTLHGSDVGFSAAFSAMRNALHTRRQQQEDEDEEKEH